MMIVVIDILMIVVVNGLNLVVWMSLVWFSVFGGGGGLLEIQIGKVECQFLILVFGGCCIVC